MNENERVKALRKELRMTLETFSSCLGVGKAAISKIENSQRGLTDQMSRAICREFNVNEEWLRTGSGEMFVQTTDDYISQVCRERGFDEKQSELLRILVNLCLKLTPEQIEYVNSELTRIAGKDPAAGPSI